MAESRRRTRARDGRPTPGPRSPSPRPGSLLEVQFEPLQRGHPIADPFRAENATVHLIGCRLGGSSPPSLLRWLDVEADPGGTDRLVRSIQRRLGSASVAAAPLGPGRLLLRVKEPAPPICLATLKTGGICMVCPLLPTSDHDPWRVVVPRGPESRELLNRLPEEANGSFAVRRVEPYRSRASLTRRQDLALRTAFDLGYFAYPRRATLGDVARALGVGRSTTLEVLRRATAKLAGRRYGADPLVRGLPEPRRPRSRAGR